MPTPSTPATPTIKPTARDLAILFDIARFKFLTSKHIQPRHFPNTNDNNAANRLSKLFAAKFLSRVYAHPKIRGQEKAHPTGVYFFSKPNQDRLKNYLETSGQASAWDEFERNLPSYNKNAEYSALYLFHELGISDFFLALEAATAEHPTLSLVFWERTSPFSRDIGETLTGHAPDPAAHTTTGKLHFNPDGFFCLKDRTTGAHFFYFLELDNNTATVAKFRQKLYGYMAYQSQGRFAALLDRYNGKYLLGLRHTGRAGFRVLTLTPHAKRRDDLFLDALTVRDEREKAGFKMFLYASLDDVTQYGALAPVCLRGKEYAPLADEQKQLPDTVTPAKLRKWQEMKLETLRRVTLLDE